jgi:hypothetical protein
VETNENHKRASIEHCTALMRLPVAPSCCPRRPLSDISHIRWRSRRDMPPSKPPEGAG